MRSSIHISLEGELLKRFTELTEKGKKSRNQVISEIIEQWIEDQEDLMLAEKAMQEIHSGADSVISYEEFKSEMKKY